MTEREEMEAEAARLVEGVDADRYPAAEELARNVLWMARGLDRMREEMGDAPACVEYDNGGGQRGTRENPAFAAYHKQLGSFMRARDELEKIVRSSRPAEISCDMPWLTS